MYRAYGHEKITVTATAVGFTTGEVTGKWPQLALVNVEDAGIRITFDGTTPNDGTKTGHPIAVGQSFLIEGEIDIRAFRMVRVGGSDATVNVTYFQVG